MAKKAASVRRSRAYSEDDAAFDVPAAVLCAFCGEADCMGGCSHENEQGSGVVAIIPWERPGTSVWSRLWATATASTQGAQTFFAALPDGEIPPAMRFAILAETLAVVSMIALFVPLAAIALPNLALEVMVNPALRFSALCSFAIGVPVLAAWMVFAHATHGAALDVGARRHGGRPQRRRAVRFGLYACGWDLMAGPLGAAMLLSSKGYRAMAELVGFSVHVPGNASRAFLEGVYGLPADAAARAQKSGSMSAVMLAILSGFGVVTLILIL